MPIPYSRKTPEELPGACMKHIGVYAFRKSFLKSFCAEPPCSLEKAESLEQLRALYLGARIRVVETDGDSWGVDTPEDVVKIEKMLKERTAHGR
jgi:3-deoxy-manno-octulosonate cytidylyltransferase (CMP-KDO synthetase)